MPTQFTRSCAFCKTIFTTSLSTSRISKGLYCSRRCVGFANGIPLIDRFFENIGRKTESGCILWNGNSDKDGYGIISCKRKILKAHRLSYEFLIGPIYNLCVRHRITSKKSRAKVPPTPGSTQRLHTLRYRK